MTERLNAEASKNATWSLEILPIKEESQEKFKPNFEGPYVVTKVLSGEASYLSEIDVDTSHELVIYKKKYLYKRPISLIVWNELRPLSQYACYPL